MGDRAAWLVPPDECVDEEDFSPADPGWVEPPADPIDLSPAALLHWADALPPDGFLVDVLLSIETTGLSNDLQVRLASQWARVEAAAGGRKFAAVAAVTIADKAPDEIVDFRDSEIASALKFGTNAARNLMANAATLAKKAPQVLAAMRGRRDRIQPRDSVRRGGHLAGARPVRAGHRANPGEGHHAHAGRAATVAA